MEVSEVYRSFFRRGDMAPRFAYLSLHRNPSHTNFLPQMTQIAADFFNPRIARISRKGGQASRLPSEISPKTNFPLSFYFISLRRQQRFRRIQINLVGVFDALCRRRFNFIQILLRLSHHFFHRPTAGGFFIQRV